MAERYQLGALDEACRCLEEGIAPADDIDVALRLGAGWSAGPFAWADGEGAGRRAGAPRGPGRAAGPRFTPRDALVAR